MKARRDETEEIRRQFLDHAGISRETEKEDIEFLLRFGESLSKRLKEFPSLKDFSRHSYQFDPLKPWRTPELDHVYTFHFYFNVPALLELRKDSKSPNLNNEEFVFSKVWARDKTMQP